MKKQDYYLGLDIGTNSVGWAATDPEYNMLKFKGEPMWGVHLFDEAKPAADRRAFRTARRRLDRRQQRVDLVQEIFSHEIAKVDPRFYIRLQESALYRKPDGFEYPLFNDKDYTDKEYYAQYPTIHHLICDLMDSTNPHDVRLVYLACAWLVAHRGHFLSMVNKDNIAAVTDFDVVYRNFEDYFEDNGYDLPWSSEYAEQIREILSGERGISRKLSALKNVLFGGKSPSKNPESAFGKEAIMKLLCGGKADAKALLNDDSFSEAGSISLSDEDEKIAEFMSELDERASVIPVLKSVYDWSVLTNSLGGKNSISAAKVAVWEQHQKDLKGLKQFIRTYLPEQYNELFRSKLAENSYSSYVYHSDETLAVKKSTVIDFSDHLKKLIKDIEPKSEDQSFYNDMLDRLSSYTFLPKQKNTDNRVIPYQLYWHEMKAILNNAKDYLPFLKEIVESGLSNMEKLLTIMEFRIPYFVGPLNSGSSNAWIKRKAEGKIYPWNFAEKVDLDESEKAFIVRMTNYCTYYPGEKVLPKDSLTYHKFMVLNAINSLSIDGRPISVGLKQSIYRELFQKKKTVTKKNIADFLVANGSITEAQRPLLSGVDDKINADLKPFFIFKKLLGRDALTEDDIERIIERAAYSEDRTRLEDWLRKEYPNLSEEDVKYIGRQGLKEFGRLSHKFLNGFEGVCKDTGECFTILKALWETNDNLMQLLSDRYTFAEELQELQQDYYAEHPKKLEDRLKAMYLSPAVRRAIFRALKVTREVVDCCGQAPDKIFVETTREARDARKGRRTQSRREQILEWYKPLKNDAAQLTAELQQKTDNELRSDRLFLYFIQLGKCAYTGQAIDIADVWGNAYNIEHIYPQSLVKDDSVLNNMVLVKSEANGAKSDRYPVDAAIQNAMRPYWDMLHRHGLMTDEKYKRLTRTTSFTQEEKQGFINRQLVETSQSTKAVIALLKEHYPTTEIVYSKAGLVSDFRQQFGMLKSRSFNDLHHAKDAYLNIVVGNVYHMRFTRWFRITDKYSIKTETIFSREVNVGNECIWHGSADIVKVKETIKKNNAHLTVYAYTKKGGLFDQMPLKKAEGLVPRKAGMPPEMYGGYNKKAIAGFLLVRYAVKEKYDLMLLPVELMRVGGVYSDMAVATDYASDKLFELLKKDVSDLSFPLGLRKIKINTVFSFDGFRMAVGGVSGGEKTLIMKPLMALNASPEIEAYVQKVESTVRKMQENHRYQPQELLNGISSAANLMLYDFYCMKANSSPYNKRPNNPSEIFKSGRERFLGQDLDVQLYSLMQMGIIFGRMSAGCDLKAIGGSPRSAATISFSTKASLWTKSYACVQIIDMDASGLHEKYSVNILELI